MLFAILFNRVYSTFQPPFSQTHPLISSPDMRRGIEWGGHPPLFSREGERGCELKKSDYRSTILAVYHEKRL